MWDGKDIVDRIQKCKLPQEIGSHSFSHSILGDPEYRPESLASELQMCRQLSEMVGVELTSFAVGHLDVLPRSGYITYRGPNPTCSSRFTKLARLLRKLIATLGRPSVWPEARSWPLDMPLVFPRIQDGMWNFPSTHYYVAPTRVFRVLPNNVWLPILKRQLSQPARRRAPFYLFFHSQDLTLDANNALRGLNATPRVVKPSREAGELDNPTTGELAESLEQGFQIATRELAGPRHRSI